MAGLTFRFAGRESQARGWDVRFRVAATAVVSAGLVGAPAGALVPLGLGVLGLLALAGSTVRETLRVVGGFAGFLGFFFAVGLGFEPTLAQGIFLGVQAARLLLLLLLGQFLFLTATPQEVTEGIRWYLGWLGRRRAWMVASMAAWALGSVPLVLDQAAGLLDAAALRGLTLRRHPVAVLKLVTLGLLVRTLERSMDLAAALEARGFGLEVPSPQLQARPRDGGWLGVTVGVVAASWVGGAIVTP